MPPAGALSSRDCSFSARAAKAFATQGLTVPADVLAPACDFVRLVSQVAGGRPEMLIASRTRIVGTVCARWQLPPAVADTLVRLAERPEHRAMAELRAVEAFTARFGSAATTLLREADEESVELDEYAERYGSRAALDLLDAMFAVLSSAGLKGPELRRLEEASAALGVDSVLFSALHRRYDPRLAAGDFSVPLIGTRFQIGRSPAADLVLPDPLVALTHAELRRATPEVTEPEPLPSAAAQSRSDRVTDDFGKIELPPEAPARTPATHVPGGWRVLDAESGRPTVLNGRPVQSAPIGAGDELRIGPYQLRVDPDRDVLHVWGDRAFSALSTRHLSRRVGSACLLDDVSFTVFSGEVIAMVGPSGAGKTTLLNAIAGIAPADSGEVLLDGHDFHTLLAADRSQVGVVPQDDIVHPELTVAESLAFSGRLRFSDDTRDHEVQASVDRVLAELGIEHIRDSRIGDALRRGISGGQRKRVNLGQELLTSSTRLLFLDEPTSGLDPRAASDIVRLVRQLADRGRIVFLVTHDLSPQIMAQVDHLLVLAPGGRLAWFGPPREACRYFSVPTPDAIFSKFHEQTPEAWGLAYRESPEFQKYVETREHLLGMDLRRPPPVAVAPKPQSPRTQFSTLLRRYLKVKLRDRVGFWVLAAQPPFLALVMTVVFPRPTPSMLFMLALSCLWFGMSVAVRELLSDRVIWRRERRVGVGVIPYVASKALVLTAIAVVQCTFLALLNYSSHSLWECGFHPLVFAAISSLAGVVGVALGLLMSASFSSSEAAVGTLPLLLIPQIAFSSILVSLRHMEPLARALSWLNPQRYAFDALLKSGQTIAEPPRYGLEWKDPIPLTGPLYEYGLKGSSVDDMGLTLPTLVMVLSGFTLLLGAATILQIHRRDREG